MPKFHVQRNAQNEITGLVLDDRNDDPADDVVFLPGGGDTTSAPVGSYNVLNTGDPRRNAVGDGQSHPLSERFTSLADAQSAFPRATALTEEIDRHAVQYAFDNYSSIYLGDKTLMLDLTVFTSDGTGKQQLGNQDIFGAGPASTVLKLRNGAFPTMSVLRGGNARSIANLSGPTVAEAPALNRLTLRDFRIDGNKANLAAGGGRAGIYLTHCNNLRLENLEIENCRQHGIWHTGVIGESAYSQYHTYRRIYIHDCGSINDVGLWVGLKTRKVTYDQIIATNNGGVGVLLDHSECQTTAIVASNNGSDGIRINNLFGSIYDGLGSTQNGKHGIRVSGLTDSVIGSWVSISNGTLNDGNTYADVYFDNVALNYGTTARVSGGPILCGATDSFGTGPGRETHALYIEDGVNQQIDLDVRYVGNKTPPTVAYSRLPANRGTMTIHEYFPTSVAGMTPVGRLANVDTGVPTLANLVGNGTAPPAASLKPGSTNLAGQINFGSGTAPPLGSQIRVTFSQALTSVPTIVVGSAGTFAAQPYVDNIDATGFDVGLKTAPAAGASNTTFKVTYMVIGA